MNKDELLNQIEKNHIDDNTEHLTQSNLLDNIQAARDELETLYGKPKNNGSEIFWNIHRVNEEGVILDSCTIKSTDGNKNENSIYEGADETWDVLAENEQWLHFIKKDVTFLKNKISKDLENKFTRKPKP